MNIRRVFVVVGFLLTVLSLGFGYNLFTTEGRDPDWMNIAIRFCLYGFIIGISTLLAGLGIVWKK